MSNPDTAKPVWAARIREARGDVSQEVFAHTLSVSVRTVNRWERGKSSPRWGHALRLSRVTGKSAAFFLGQDDEEEAADAMRREILNVLGGLVQDARGAERVA